MIKGVNRRSPRGVVGAVMASEPEGEELGVGLTGGRNSLSVVHSLFRPQSQMNYLGRRGAESGGLPVSQTDLLLRPAGWSGQAVSCWSGTGMSMARNSASSRAAGIGSHSQEVSTTTLPAPCAILRTSAQL